MDRRDSITSCRLIVDLPSAGSWNMAVDQTLLESTAQDGRPSLRFYQWSQPTLSLGYFQNTDQRLQHVTSQDCRLIRRTSGGGAIVHDNELTYCLTFPCRDSRLRKSSDLVEIVHQALIETLNSKQIEAKLYKECEDDDPVDQPFLCFQRRACGDIVLNNYKILGSAQRRFRNAILQHGSLLLKQSSHAPELPGLEDLLGKEHSLKKEDILEKWSSLLSSRLGFDFYKEEITTAEIVKAESLRKNRFENSDWTFRR